MVVCYSDPIQAVSAFVVMCFVVRGYIKTTQYFGSPHINLSQTWSNTPRQYMCVISIVNLGSSTFIVGETIRLTAVGPQGELTDIKLVTQQASLNVKPGDSRGNLQYSAKCDAVVDFSGFYCYEINVTNSRGKRIIKKYMLSAAGQPIPLWQCKIGRLLARVSPRLMDKWVILLSKNKLPRI